jgi:large subunit ribosomal protein L25
MEKIVLHADSRSKTKPAKLRSSGKLPAVVYGHGIKSTPLELDARSVEKAWMGLGSSGIFHLKIDEARAKNVLFHAIQQDPRTGMLLHADLYVVKMDEKIKTEVPLHYVGESTAVYQQEGTLLKNLETLEVEALPGDLPSQIEVDISVLDDFEKAVHVADLSIPENVAVLTDPEELVTRVEPPRSEEELAELDEAPVEELPEGVQEDTAVASDDNEGERDEQNKSNS